MGSRRGKKRLDGDAESDIPKKRRQNPAFTPFKQVEIPSSWKFESQKLREAVRTSVAHCHYDDPLKRERLENAVFEALIGQKTMKAAATIHGVPFTTLQTYFHRSRARMATMMSDNDKALPEQIQIAVPASCIINIVVDLSLLSSDTSNAFVGEKKLEEQKQASRLESMLNFLMGRAATLNVSNNAISPSPNVSSKKVGSSKRKPTKVHRIVPTVNTKDENLNWLIDDLQDLCTSKLKLTSLKFDADPEEQLQKCSNEMLSKSSFFDSENVKGQDMVDKCTNDVCRVSQYRAPQSEILCRAVAMAVLHDYSTCGADDLMQLPTTTLQSYIQRAQTVPTSVLHQQAISHEKDEGSSGLKSDAYPPLLNDCISMETQKVISNLLKSSTYDDEAGRQKLHHALLEVLTKDIPVAEVSSKYHILASTIQPYITEARILLGQSPYPTTSSSKEPKSGKEAEDQLNDITENVFNRMSINKGPSPATNFLASNTNFRTNALQPNRIKTYSEDGKQAESQEEGTQSVKSKKLGKSTAFLKGEYRFVDDEDDEFGGLPRSIRGVARLLSDTKLGKISMKEYPGTVELLTNKIDKMLRQYRFRGDSEKMRDAILQVLYESKTLSEACKGNNLAPTTLSTYVRIVKALINTEKVGVKEAYVASSSSKIEAREDGNGQTVDLLSTSSGLSADTPSEQLAKKVVEVKRYIPVHLDGPLAEIRRNGIEQLAENVNVMALHTNLIMNDLESFYKLLISYLIGQQYKRSGEAQEKMRLCLEYVLLDGLSIPEALKVHEGPTEHVLQVYLNRCREVNKCIKIEFANFKEAVAEAINKNCSIFPRIIGSFFAKERPKISAEFVKNKVRKRSSKRLQKKEDNEMRTDMLSPVNSLELLNMIFCEDLRKPLYDYLRKLDGVNFPIEDCLIVGLAKLIIDELPAERKFKFSDSVWEQWLATYRKKYQEFVD